MAKYIFICGGVMSGVGKGVATASIAKILQWQGYRTTCIKIDPYVNVDAGTMNPIEHGEVFVLKDGCECDQDMGHYERFLQKELTRAHYMTTGSIYLSVIKKERSLAFGGRCVEVVPHIPLEVIEKIEKARRISNSEIVLTEIGGTVGEYQNILFLEAVRILKQKRPKDVLLILVSYLPYQGEGRELKTKPTQYAIRTLNSAGLQPDFVLGRAVKPLDLPRKEKIAFNCNLSSADIISAPDERNIYKIPLNFEKDGLSKKILKKLALKPKRKKDENKKVWQKKIKDIEKIRKKIKIGIVGKYFKTGSFILEDAYISVIEAIKHASWELGFLPEIFWLDSESYEKDKKDSFDLKEFDGIIIPGGFGKRGVEGKILAIKYCRENKIPCFGLCFGLQLMVIEFARNVCQIKRATSREIDPQGKEPVIDLLKKQKKFLKKKLFGGTMRLGDWPCFLKKKTLAAESYQKEKIIERHRHRYELNPKYHQILQKYGLVFSGTSKDRVLVEIIELSQKIHPFFLGVQFHPEFKSQFLKPHPLFLKFIESCKKE